MKDDLLAAREALPEKIELSSTVEKTLSALSELRNHSIRNLLMTVAAAMLYLFLRNLIKGAPISPGFIMATLFIPFAYVLQLKYPEKNKLIGRTVQVLLLLSIMSATPTWDLSWPGPGVYYFAPFVLFSFILDGIAGALQSS